MVLEKAIRLQSPRPQFPHGDYVNLAESLAQEIGVSPDLEQVKKNDMALYNILCTDPLIPAHYRINGPYNNP